ncbi:MAG TPA: SOS response-associated peptidase [Pirellulales bacterium]|nr:SOS response-associated peptidase [Pirellulales bacterium]
MCGRFTLRTEPQQVAKHFELAELPLFQPRYNIAPTQPAPVIRLDQSGRRVLNGLRWGLVPSWAKDLAIGNQLINARCETLATKPAFRHAFRRRRCLVAADGFYEWQRQGKRKQPFYITAADGAPLAFAGLWERWEPTDAPNAGTGRPTPVESCTVITTTANEHLRTLHDRMPVILPRATWATWLDAAAEDTAVLQKLLVPSADDGLTMHAVSPLVNSPSTDDPRCVEPLANSPPQPAERLLF